MMKESQSCFGVCLVFQWFVSNLILNYTYATRTIKKHQSTHVCYACTQSTLVPYETMYQIGHFRCRPTICTQSLKHASNANNVIQQPPNEWIDCMIKCK